MAKGEKHLPGVGWLLFVLAVLPFASGSVLAGSGASDKTTLPELTAQDFRFNDSANDYHLNFEPSTLEMHEIKDQHNWTTPTPAPGFDHHTPTVELDDFIYQFNGHTVRGACAPHSSDRIC